MKRSIVAALLTLSLAVAMVTMFGAGSQSSAVAQDDAAARSLLHPIVGSWLLSVDARDPESPPVLAVYHADGTYTDSAVDRSGGVGVWEAIDDTSVANHIVFHSEDGSTTHIRSVATVDESGNAYTSEHTREVIGADGTSSGEMGPGTATGERIMIEERGESAGAMMEAEATPAE